MDPSGELIFILAWPIKRAEARMGDFLYIAISRTNLDSSNDIQKASCWLKRINLQRNCFNYSNRKCFFFVCSEDDWSVVAKYDAFGAYIKKVNKFFSIRLRFLLIIAMICFTTKKESPTSLWRNSNKRQVRLLKIWTELKNIVEFFEGNWILIKLVFKTIMNVSK